ncbi:glycosyltransferase [Baekduia soli]|nr:glycosyltransferase [Baekduia soli]
MVSVVMPTLNAERHLEECLTALRDQHYPGEVELIVPDAGSTDRTLEIVSAFRGRVVPNPLKSGEAGKAVGVAAARGDLVLLLDSDNVLVGRDWLARMVVPFVEDPDVFCAEPARFAYRSSDHFINRWHALLGAGDPLTLYTGNYARDSRLTGRWTDYPHRAEPRNGWQRVELDPRWVPVLGANGFMIRRAAYDIVPVGDYLFDLDYVHDLVQAGRRIMARPDVGVVHLFCDSAARYRTKTRRRVDDFFYFEREGDRSYPWTGKRRTRGMVDFAVSTALVVPIVSDAVRGHRQAPDAAAWAWHVAACWITLAVYATGVIRGRLKPRMLDREGWRQ